MGHHANCTAEVGKGRQGFIPIWHPPPSTVDSCAANEEPFGPTISIPQTIAGNGAAVDCPDGYTGSALAPSRSCGADGTWGSMISTGCNARMIWKV